MSDTLVQAYLPLFLWTGLGLLSFRWVPDGFPRFLGRSLYWVGVPLQIFTLARQTHFSERVELAPSMVIFSLLSGLGLAWVGLQLVRQMSGELSAEPDAHAALNEGWHDPAHRGSFVIASMLGNTGFVGLAVAPSFIDESYLGWLVFYSVTQNVLGTYGLGVFLSSYYGRSQKQRHWLITLRDVLTVPSLWAFGIGFLTRTVALPDAVEGGLQGALWIIISCALLLMGLRLRQLHGWKSLKLALVPTVIKVILMPMIVGIAAVCLHLPGDPRLALVLMAGMPTAFAGLILAEEYDLDRELIAGSIVLTTAMLLLAIPLWLLIFGERAIA